VTGAVRLTDIKAGLGPTFFAQIGLPLAAKLALAFLVINVATYVAFGCGLRIVRAQQGDLPVDAQWQRRMLVRVAVATCLALGLTVVAIRVSLGIGTLLHGAAPAPHAAPRDTLLGWPGQRPPLPRIPRTGDGAHARCTAVAALDHFTRHCPDRSPMVG